jgi:uncharacterized membrane protein
MTIMLAGLLGTAFAIVMPPFQFNDEHGHFARAYQISRGEVIGHRNPQIPPAILSSLERYPEPAPGRSRRLPLIEGAGPGGGGPKLTYFSWSILAAQLYAPIVYLPASAGIAAARVLGMSPVAMLYAARLMDVLCFLTALTAAFLLAPGFRALAAVIALMPMTLCQAAAVSADQAAISFALFGFALVLRTREQPVSGRYLGLLLFTIPLWAMCKNSFWALPLLLLIPGGQFKSRGRRAAFLLAAMFLTIALAVFWNHLTRDAFADFRAAGLARGIDLSGNMRLVAAHPFEVMAGLVAPGNLGRLAGQYIGGFGWIFIAPPRWVTIVYPALLLATAAIGVDIKRLTIAERGLVLSIFLVALIGTHLLLFVVDGTFRSGHYSFWSAGVQGRYMIPFSIAALLALKRNAAAVSYPRLAPGILSVSILCALASLAAISAYYR